MRGVVTGFLYVSESQSHYRLTPVNPHFLLLWRSGNNNNNETCKTEKRTVVFCHGRHSFGFVFVCVFHLHGLELWRLDDRGLCSLNDPVDLNRLSIRELHQCYCGTCCGGMACRHGYLKFRSNCGTT